MMKKTMVLSAILASVLTVGSAALPITGISSPITITASAASDSQIQQLRSDMQTISNHINYVSYLKRGKASNRYNVVAAYQRTLNTLYSTGLTVDGDFGPATERATAYSVQRPAGVTADGITGVGTLKVLRAKADAYISANTVKAATVSISVTSAPSSLVQGSAHDICGKITSSGAPISSFKGEIISSSGSVVQSKTVYPNSYSVNIQSSFINYALKFGSLKEGSNYILKLTATAGGTVKTYTKKFDVRSKKAVISFHSISAPSSLSKNKSFSLSGTVRSTNKPIYSITASIKNSSGSTVMSKTVYPNSYSYSIKNSPIDMAMKFGLLSAGNYMLEYNVTASDGTTSSKSYSFKVNDPYNNIVVVSNSSSNAAKLLQAAKSDLGKNSSQMGFPYGQDWCAYSVGKWLKTAGINLGSTASVNDAANRLVEYGYSSSAYVFRDSRGKFTNDNLYNRYGSGKAQRVENRYDIVPQAGDIICFRWKGTSYENYSHIGIVTGYDPITHTITTIEGNYGYNNKTSKVSTVSRSFDSTVVAVVRLK